MLPSVSVNGRENAMARAKHSVLVVDAHSFVCETFCDMLSELGYQALPAANIEEAMLMLRRPERIDVLLAHLELFRDTATEITAQARRFHPKIAIVLTSSGRHASDEQRYSFPILQKPFSGEVMAGVLEAELALSASG